MSRQPLPLSGQPFCRWLVLPVSWNRLHRIAEMNWEDGEMIAGRGVTLCGRRGRMCMPGVCSRLGLPRCAHCCRLAGVPRGDGVPWNQGIDL